MTQALAPKITIDTNCVVGLFDSKTKTATSVDELRELMRYALSGVIQISVTTRVEVDFERDKNDERRKEMLHRMSMFPVIGTVARWDQSKVDGADVLAGPAHQGLLDEVKRIVFPSLRPESGKFPNKLAYIDHLVGHKLAGRDVFVTDDKDILRRDAELRGGPGILVMSPVECLRYVDEHRARGRSEQTLMPRRQPLEGVAADLVVALARACPNGRALTFYTLEQLGQLLPDADPAEIQMAVFDLDAAKLLKLQRFLGGWRVGLGKNFYAQIDHQVIGWSTERDAVEIARLIVDDPAMARAERIHQRLDWPLRRLNLALSFLKSKTRASETIDRTYATPQFLRCPEDIAALQRFICTAFGGV